MDLAMPPMPFSAVFVPKEGNAHLKIPEEMRNSSSDGAIELPPGVVQVIATWKGRDPIIVRHYVNGHGYETVHAIPASSSGDMRSSGVLTLSSDVGHQVQVIHGTGTGSAWEPVTLAEGYVVGVQVMPMGTAADITGGGSMLRVDNSVGTRVFLGDTMIHGDTGWRDVSDRLLEGWSGQIWLRRRGDLVTILVLDLERSISGASNMMYLPSGYRSPVYGISGFNYGTPYPMANANSANIDIAGFLHLAGSGYIVRASYKSGVTGLQGDATWSTNDDWPTSLPGIAV